MRCGLLDSLAVEGLLYIETELREGCCCNVKKWRKEFSGEQVQGPWAGKSLTRNRKW